MTSPLVPLASNDLFGGDQLSVNAKAHPTNTSFQVAVTATSLGATQFPNIQDSIRRRSLRNHIIRPGKNAERHNQPDKDFSP